MAKKEQGNQAARRAFLKLGVASVAAGALWSATDSPVWAEELTSAARASGGNSRTSDRKSLMFVRLIDAPIKPGKRNELISILASQLQPMLKKQAGFVDFVWLTGDTNTAEFISVTFWATKHQADTFYNSRDYGALTDRTQSLHEYMKSRTFYVEVSTLHKVAAVTA